MKTFLTRSRYLLSFMVIFFCGMNNVSASEIVKYHIYVEFFTDGLDTENKEHIIRDSFVEIVNPNNRIERVYCDAPNGSWTTNICERAIQSTAGSGVYKVYTQVAVEVSVNKGGHRPVRARVPYIIRITTTDHDTENIEATGRVSSVSYVNPNKSTLGTYTYSFSIK